jgi:NADPH:quinone reductase-like Zn-dependent oxidoreductase
MKVFEIRGDWGFDHLQLGTRPDPQPGPGQVLLRMKAASLNYRDLVVPNRGYGAFTGNLPLIPLSDGVGEVIEVGQGVARVKVGDRVCPCFHQSWIGGPPDLERLTRAMVSRLLRPPITQLTSGNLPPAVESMRLDLLRELFALDPDDAPVKVGGGAR